MSRHLPVISGREAAKAFTKIGFETLAGRGKGSHIRMRRDSDAAKLTIPDHNPIKRGTLRSIIRDAGLTVDEFRELL